MDTQTPVFVDGVAFHFLVHRWHVTTPQPTPLFADGSVLYVWMVSVFTDGSVLHFWCTGDACSLMRGVLTGFIGDPGGHKSHIYV